MTLRQGKYRQIRRMCELVGLEVVSLRRVGIGGLTLGGLGLLPGQWRVLNASELGLLVGGGGGGGGVGSMTGPGFGGRHRHAPWRSRSRVKSG